MVLGARVENLKKKPIFGVFTPKLTVFGFGKKSWDDSSEMNFFHLESLICKGNYMNQPQTDPFQCKNPP